MQATPARKHSSAALLKAVGAKAEGAGGERTSCSSDGSGGAPPPGGAGEAAQQLAPGGGGAQPVGRSVDAAARDEWARAGAGAARLPSVGSADGSGSGGFGNLGGARAAARRSVNIRRSICSRGQRTGAAERISGGAGGNAAGRQSLSLPRAAAAAAPNAGDVSPREGRGSAKLGSLDSPARPLQSQGSAKAGFPDAIHKDSPPPPAGGTPPDRKRLPSAAAPSKRRVSISCERPATPAEFSKGLMALQSALFQSTAAPPSLPGGPKAAGEAAPPSHCALLAQTRGADTNDILCRNSPALDRAALRPVRISLG